MLAVVVIMVMMMMMIVTLMTMHMQKHMLHMGALTRDFAPESSCGRQRETLCDVFYSCSESPKQQCRSHILAIEDLGRKNPNSKSRSTTKEVYFSVWLLCLFMIIKQGRTEDIITYPPSSDNFLIFIGLVGLVW